jgi:hypothetical protein
MALIAFTWSGVGYAADGESAHEAAPTEGEIGTRATPMPMQKPGLTMPRNPQILQAIPSTPPPPACWKIIEPPFQGAYVAPTHYQTVPAAAFSLASQPALGIHFSLTARTGFRAWRDSNQIANRITFAAPGFLPQSAVIRQVEVFLKDDDPQYNLYFSLEETLAATGSDHGPFGAMLATTSDCVNSPQSTILLVNGFAVTINSQHAYWMHVEWDVSNLNNATFDSGIHFYFVRLGYTLQ